MHNLKSFQKHSGLDFCGLCTQWFNGLTTFLWTLQCLCYGQESILVWLYLCWVSQSFLLLVWLWYHWWKKHLLGHLGKFQRFNMSGGASSASLVCNFNCVICTPVQRPHYRFVSFVVLVCPNSPALSARGASICFLSPTCLYCIVPFLSVFQLIDIICCKYPFAPSLVRLDTISYEFVS